jgi:adenylate cyclase
MRVWTALLTLPLAGLVLLLARPGLDAHWEHHPSHFWLVLSTAIVSVGLALLTGEVARRREDARLVLVSLAFLASAGFLALHALATPGVLLEDKNAGFVIATPVGLFAGAVFSAASALDLGPAAAAAVLRAARLLRAGWGYLRVFRRRRTILLAGVVTAFALLAEAMIAVAVGRNWHASWWESHLLMTAAFASVASSAYIEYRRHESATGAFSALLLDHSLERLDRHYHVALERLVTALDRGDALGPVLAGLQSGGRMTEEEVKLLERAALELHRLDHLFRPYLSPQLAARLRERPQLAELGGEEREV